MKTIAKRLGGRLRISSGAVIESLETRAYFDLVPSISGAIPTEVVATVKNNLIVTVDLTNNAGTTARGPFTLALFASTQPTFGAATDTQVSSISKTAASFLPNKSTAFKLKLTDFPDVANRNYYLIAQVTGSLAGTSDNVAASSTTIAVADPFIDLSDSVSIVSPADDSVLPGKAAGLSIEVFNNGNIPATGPLLIDLGLTAGLTPDVNTIQTDIEEAVVPAGTTSPHIHIAAGGHQILHVNEKVPVGFTPGTYVWEASIDPANTFNESNTTNNTAFSTASQTVQDPYPNLLGTFAGPDHIKSGPDKGVTVEIELDFTSESETTGALSANGTLIEGDGTTAGFNFAGTISTKGVFSGKGTSSSPFFATYNGKLAKGVLSGKVVNTDGNSGLFSLVESSG
jgi:hypothetical protein